jgi:hypothetical protein
MTTAKSKAPKTPKPSRSQYEIRLDSGKLAHLTRVTTILDWTIKGDGFGAMAYYGGGLFSKFLFPDLDDEAREGVVQLWKESEHDPNRTLRETSKRGGKAHKLFEHLCQGVAVLQTTEAPWRVEYLEERYMEAENELLAPEDFIATEYDAGVCKVFHELFQHLDINEMLSETRVYYIDHEDEVGKGIDDCPDDICTHGYAGTLDGLIPQYYVMLDMKTNKGDARWSAYPQMAFYGKAAEQRGLIDGPIQKQMVVIPRPDGEYELFDDKFVDTGIVQPILDLYRYRRAWGPKS